MEPQQLFIAALCRRLNFVSVVPEPLFGINGKERRRVLFVENPKLASRQSLLHLAHDATRKLQGAADFLRFPETFVVYNDVPRTAQFS